MTESTTSQDIWTVRRVLEWTIPHLKKHGSESPRLDAEILLAHARGCPRIKLYTDYDTPLTEAQRQVMRELVQRRTKAEPVAYLVGHREFFGINFQLTSDVLIPRPDTETLVLQVLERARDWPAPRILDLGTGSGCIAISIAQHLKHADVTATDISPAALEVARRNAERNKLGERIRFSQGDLFVACGPNSRFDIIASNPPYVTTSEIEKLAPDVRLHEPRLALDGGQDGLTVIQRLIAETPDYLNDGGYLMIEIACEQSSRVEELLRARGRFADIRSIADTSGRPRVVLAKMETKSRSAE